MNELVKNKNRRFYERNREKAIKESVANNRIKRKKFRDFIRRYKIMVGCKLCGYKKYHKALELHHTGELKKMDKVSAMRHTSMKRVKDEMRKCIVVCANCPREIHGNITDLTHI